MQRGDRFGMGLPFGTAPPTGNFPDTDLPTDMTARYILTIRAKGNLPDRTGRAGQSVQDTVTSDINQRDLMIVGKLGNATAISRQRRWVKGVRHDLQTLQQFASVGTPQAHRALAEAHNQQFAVAAKLEAMHPANTMGKGRTPQIRASQL